MKKEYANYILKKTGEDYNRIADQFSDSRYSIWPELNILRKYIKAGEKVLDLGCGNGRLFAILKDKNVDYLGVDNSEKLIEIAKKIHPRAKFQVADALNLPFPNNCFDKIFCIAVLHHIPSDELRNQFISEAKRVLKPEGLLILTVWNLWQRFSLIKLIIKFTILKIFRKVELDLKDIFVPWQKTLNRYIHCFTKSELRKLVKKTGLKVKETGVLKRRETRNYNIFLIAEKELSP